MLHERLNPPGKQTARDHDPVPATEADETNVRTQADDLPIGTAARVRLPEAYDVFKRNIEWHATTPHQAARVIPALSHFKSEL